MRENANYESDSFEYDSGELDELDEVGAFFDPPPGLVRSGGTSRELGRGGCPCQRGSAAAMNEMDSEFSLGSIPSWLNPVYRLYGAGRLGWRAGRWLDKQSGKVLGKPISEWGAEYLLRKFGRSRRLEEFYDSLPAPLKRWLRGL
jgi:hypothetical protein